MKKENLKKGISVLLILMMSLFLLTGCGNSNEDEKVYVTKEGDLTIELDNALYFSEGLAPVCKDDKWGYIDQTGAVVIDYQFEGAAPFSDGMALVMKNDKTGFIDKTGNIVIACKYDNAGEEGFQNGVARVYLDKEWGVINKAGEIVVPFGKYYKIKEFQNGFAQVESETARDYTSKTGYIDVEGNEIVEMDLDNLGLQYFSEGLAVKSNAKYNSTLDTISNRKYGYVDENLNMIIEQKYKKAGSFSEGLAPVSEDGEKIGYIDKEGNLVIDYQFHNAMGFSEGYAVVNNGEKCGVIDKQGNLVVDYKYDYIMPFSEGLAAFVPDLSVDADEQKVGYINTKGEVVVEPIYDAKAFVSKGFGNFSEGLALVCKDGKFGYVNYDGKIIIGNI